MFKKFLSFNFLNKHLVLISLTLTISLYLTIHTGNAQSYFNFPDNSSVTNLKIATAIMRELTSVTELCSTRVGGGEVILTDDCDRFVQTYGYQLRLFLVDNKDKLTNIIQPMDLEIPNTFLKMYVGSSDPNVAAAHAYDLIPILRTMAKISQSCTERLIVGDYSIYNDCQDINDDLVLHLRGVQSDAADDINEILRGAFKKSESIPGN
jgi:hypothetical protein